MKRQPSPLALRVNYDEQGKLRFAVTMRTTGEILSYYSDVPKRGCIASRSLSRAISDIQIGA